MMRGMSNRSDLPPGEPVALSALRAGQRVRAVNQTRGGVLAEDVRLALGPWTRLRGLLGTAPLQSGEGLLLRPCSAVHTCFMGYAIDVLFLDDGGRVVGAHAELVPWRFTPIHGAALATLELSAGALARSGTVLGDEVAFCRR